MTLHSHSTDTTRILGAGPAGLTAAITLARAGRAVVVYERAPDVGTRHEGDYEAIENWTTREDMRAELAAWGVQANFRCVPIHALTCFGPGFRGESHVEDSHPLLYVVLRGSRDDSLDRGLLAQAREAGARVEFRHTAPLDQVDIVATGFPRARAFVAGYTFATRAPNACYMCLDSKLTPTLYSYLITCEGRGTIGFGAAAPQSDLNQILDRVVAGFRSRVRFEIESPQYFVAAGTFGLPQTAQRDGRLYVGEAAELQDPLFGFGLRMSMTTGYLAARGILDGRDYDSLWQARLTPQLQAAAVHRMLFQQIGNIGYRLLLPYVRLFARAGRDLCHRYYQPMWYTRLLWPLAKRRLLAERRTQDARISQARSLRRKTDQPTGL
jgi:flavin-dependent dehydrogenase